MAIQRKRQRLPKQVEADWLAAILTASRMTIDEDFPLLVPPTADGEKDGTAAAHQPPQNHRPALKLPPDLPSGTLRRRNTFSSRSTANGGEVHNNNNNGCGYSTLQQTPTMLHELEHQNQNPPASHIHGRRTLPLQPSPLCARVVFHQESTSLGGGRGILPLPFAVRPKNEEPTAAAAVINFK